MTDFRRWFTALAVLALFVGLASAQVGGGTTGTIGTTFTCDVSNVTQTPNLRQEGFTEMTGDILIVCSGGSPLATGTVIPTMTLSVYYPATVTSRLIGNVSGINASEALLLIDEPNNNKTGSQYGYGPSLPQIPCQFPQYGAGPNGCVETVGNNPNAFYNTGAGSSGVDYVSGATGVPVNASGGPGANVFQGVVSGQQVTFQGIPVLPPVTAGYSRVYRITNVRLNANGLGSSVAGSFTQVSAQISSALPITNPSPIVGYISKSLSATVSNAQVFPQCLATSAFSANLNFTELFGSAFKTRVDPSGGAANNYTPGTQNIPGGLSGANPYEFNSESNFILNGANGNGTLTGGTYTPGLADYGTRLKAVFSNVPAGVVVYASQFNIVNATGTSASSGQSQVVLGPSTAFGTTTTATSFAVMLSSGSEGTSDGTGSLPVASYTNSFLGPSTSGNAASYINYVGVTSQGTPIVFVWEVVNTQPLYIENIEFAVWAATSNISTTNPPAGTSTVNLSYAPTATQGAFSVTNGPTTAVNNMIPRFADTSGGGSTFLTINLCQTTLLFPYITTLTGFTTPISIANTTADPFGTTNQSGTCALNWYQAAAGTSPGNPSVSTIGPIPAGTILAIDPSTSTYAASGFSGYMIAVCNFQLAHGVAIVTDLGSQHILATYLALVVPTNTSKRNLSSSAVPEQLNN